MKRVCVFVLLLVLALSTVVAADTKWEYMVVSFGSTNFSKFYSKTMAYWDDGIDVSAMGLSLIHI